MSVAKYTVKTTVKFGYVLDHLYDREKASC